MLKLILLLVAAITLLVALGAYLLWQEFYPTVEEAVAFAKVNDDGACLDESMARLSECGGTGCQTRSLIFAHLCFPIAAPSRQMCEDLSGRLFGGGVWAAERCEELGLPVDACQRIYNSAAQTCLTLNHDDPTPVVASTAGPDEEWLGRIPSINAKVTALRFFESGEDEVDYDNLDYRTEFLSVFSRYINWELTFEFPILNDARTIDITGIYYLPDGTVMAEMDWPAELEAGWSLTRQSYGWGWPEAGNWPTGKYRVEVFAEGQRVAASSFLIE